MPERRAHLNQSIRLSSTSAPLAARLLVGGDPLHQCAQWRGASLDRWEAFAQLRDDDLRDYRRK
jgi:hypothetical protein